MARNVKAWPREIHLIIFFWPDRLLSPSNHGKGLAFAKTVNEKKIPKSSAGSLECVMVDCVSKMGTSVYFHGETLILPNFSGLRGFATLDCEYHSHAGLTDLIQRKYQPHSH